MNDKTVESHKKLIEVEITDNSMWAVVRLNRSNALQALNTEMVALLKAELEGLASNPEIKAIWLESSTPKAFCAGGDVRGVRQSVLEGNEQAGDEFFAKEYALDLYLHNYPKPIVAWAEGYVMGGGMGLLMACPFRIATPKTKIAMPEVSIGLFPDVGGSRFLAERGVYGLFMAMTGSMINAVDARQLNIVSHICDRDKSEILSALQGLSWSQKTNSYRVHFDIGSLLAEYHIHLEDMHTQLKSYHEFMIRLGKDFYQDYHILSSLVDSDNAWLAQAGENITNGSPTSIALAWLLWQWGLKHIRKDKPETTSWQEVFALEKDIVTWKIRHADFVEGVRARLVDKDMSPKWQSADVVSSSFKLSDVLSGLPKTNDNIWQKLLADYSIQTI